MGSPPQRPVKIKTETRVLTGQEISDGELTLAETPKDPPGLLLDVISGGPQKFNDDYTITQNILRWNGYALDGILIPGDTLRIHYRT